MAPRTPLAIKRAVARTVRLALTRYARGRPAADAEDRVTILLLSAWGMGGTIRTTLNLAGHLAARHEVEILSVFRRRDTPFFPFPDGVKVTGLDDRRPGRRGPLERLLRSRSSVLLTPHDRRLAPASLWTDLQLVRALCGRTGVVIATRPGLNLLAADLGPPGLRLIGQEHMNLRSHGKPLRRALKRSYPRLDALAVLTERDRRAYEKLLGGRLRLIVLPNAIPPDLGPPSPLTEPVVLAAGRLGRQKGFDRLIRAFAEVHERHPGWRLVIHGAGPWRERLERQVAELGVGAAVALPGPAKRLAAEMDQASVFALSSRREGFPMVLIEAMAKGLAVVAFDCPTGPREAIDDGVDGLLVPAGDVGALAAALDELMADAALRRRLAAAGVRRAGDFALSAIGPRWDALIDELIRAERAPRIRRQSCDPARLPDPALGWGQSHGLTPRDGTPRPRRG